MVCVDCGRRVLLRSGGLTPRSRSHSNACGDVLICATKSSTNSRRTWRREVVELFGARGRRERVCHRLFSGPRIFPKQKHPGAYQSGQNFRGQDIPKTSQLSEVRQCRRVFNLNFQPTSVEHCGLTYTNSSRNGSTDKVRMSNGSSC